MSATRARILLVVTSEHFYLVFSGWILANKQYHLLDTDSEHIQPSREPGPGPTGTVTKYLKPGSVISSSQLLPFGEGGEAGKLPMGLLPHFLDCKLSCLIRSSGTWNILTWQFCEFMGDSFDWQCGGQFHYQWETASTHKDSSDKGFSFLKVCSHICTITGRIPPFSNQCTHSLPEM